MNFSYKIWRFSDVFPVFSIARKNYGLPPKSVGQTFYIAYVCLTARRNYSPLLKSVGQTFYIAYVCLIARRNYGLPPKSVGKTLAAMIADPANAF